MPRELTGTYYRRGKSGMYQLRFKYKGKQYRWSLGTTREGEAARAATRKMTLVHAAILDGTFNEKYDNDKALSEAAGVQNGKLLLKGLWACYVGSSTLEQPSPSTLAQYEYQVADFLDWIRTRCPKVRWVSDVTQEIAGKFMGHLTNERHLSANSHNKYLDTLRRAFEVMRKEIHVLAVNPWVDIARRKWKRMDARRKDFIIAEAKLILARATGWMRTLFMLGFFTGQRLVDCCRLRWEQVDLREGMLRIVPRKTSNTSELVVELPMHPDLKRHLEELAGGRSALSGFVMPDVAERHRRDSSSLVCEIQDFLRTCGFKVHRDGGEWRKSRSAVRFSFVPTHIR